MRRSIRALAVPLAAACTLAALTACVSDGENAAPSTDRPGPPRPITPGRTHVIVLIIDTLRADKLSAYGYPGPTTPELDRLAADGVLFARPVAQCSWTRPSIGSMLTGLYPRTLGLYKEERERLADEFATLAELFQGAGYTTLGVTANPNINSVFGFDQGFDAYVDSDQVWGWMLDDVAAYEAEGKTEIEVGSLMPAGEVFEQAWRLIDEHPDGPYYLQLNIMEMHQFGAPLRPEFEGAFTGAPDAHYISKLRQASHDVSRFIEDWLSSSGLEDTLLIIVSDHGEGLTAHPGIEFAESHGYVLYESQLIVPLIFHHSKGGLRPGLVVRQPVRLLDLYPTLADLFGFEVNHALHGTSLTPALVNPDVPLRLPEFFVVETYFHETDKRAVYSAGWNFYEHLDDWPGTDPRELQQANHREIGSRTNRLGQHPERARILEEHLREWERLHPRIAPTLSDLPSPEVLEQLRSLGYID